MQALVVNIKNEMLSTSAGVIPTDGRTHPSIHPDDDIEITPAATRQVQTRQSHIINQLAWLSVFYIVIQDFAIEPGGMASSIQHVCLATHRPRSKTCRQSHIYLIKPALVPVLIELSESDTRPPISYVVHLAPEWQPRARAANVPPRKIDVVAPQAMYIVFHT